MISFPSGLDGSRKEDTSMSFSLAACVSSLVCLRHCLLGGRKGYALVFMLLPADSVSKDIMCFGLSIHLVHLFIRPDRSCCHNISCHVSMKFTGNIQ